MVRITVRGDDCPPDLPLLVWSNIPRTPNAGLAVQELYKHSLKLLPFLTITFLFPTKILLSGDSLEGKRFAHLGKCVLSC